MENNKTKVIATIAAVVLVVDGVTGGVAWHNQQEAVHRTAAGVRRAGQHR